jgi:hypothetical protein
MNRSVRSATATSDCPTPTVSTISQPVHARLVAQDRAARARRGGIDGEHGDAMTLADQVEPERLDEGRFAGARRA